MKSTAHSDDASLLFHVEKPETDLTEIKTVSPRKTGRPRSPAPTNVSTPLETKSKGPHNKENHRRNLSQEVTSDDEVILSSNCLTEDSGYLSLQNSQVEHTDDADSSERSEEKFASSQSSDVERPSSFVLPVLKFQEEVCKELAKSFRKSKSYDWTVVGKVAENCGLQNVIGGKMGLEFVDVLCGLMKKDMRHVLARILGLLGDSDLISCKRVSRTWQKIICQDQVALRRCREAERTRRDSGRPAGSLSRDFTLSRVVFSCMQGVASTPIHKTVKKSQCQTNGVQNTSRSSRFQQFHQVAKSLKQHESLRACVLCGCPARFDEAMQRAVCTRLSCAFDSCTKCQSAFHNSSPCRNVVRSFSASSQNALVAGSTRSKRNVRRL